MSIETPIVRIVVLVAVLVALAGGMFALLAVGHSHSSSGTPSIPVHHPVTAKHVAATVPAKPAPVRPALLPGLPGPIAYALERHPVAVVALYDHGADDGPAVAEARAGAGLAHTSFVAIDVLRPRYAGSIAAFTGTLDVPAVLVVRRPGVIVKHLAGYEDRQVVAQAAHDGR